MGAVSATAAPSAIRTRRLQAVDPRFQSLILAMQRSSDGRPQRGNGWGTSTFRWDRHPNDRIVKWEEDIYGEVINVFRKPSKHATASRDRYGRLITGARDPAPDPYRIRRHGIHRAGPQLLEDKRLTGPTKSSSNDNSLRFSDNGAGTRRDSSATHCPDDAFASYALTWNGRYDDRGSARSSGRTAFAHDNCST